MQKPVEKPIKFVKNLSTKGKSYPITHVSAVIDDNGESVKSTIDSLKNKSSITKVTWQELKDKRDNRQLIPGSLYRITDYQCTTSQENTRSAGHQFDIVLLALSENKLAEEGWAMEHPTDVYDVTFADGVTKKCYIFYKRYAEGVSMCNLVDAITLNGLVDVDLELLLINEANKTATSGDIDSTAINDLDGQAIENCPYNYFQNSNLSAWKVWYSLDNDKSRFAWAERDVPTFICNAENTMIVLSNAAVTRNYDGDSNGRYGYFLAYEGDVMPIQSDRELKDTGDYRVYFNASTSVITHVEILSSNVTANGRGVIYRLIDEFNNDIKYDFKNIQFKRKLTNGQYDATNGTETWCYTLNLWHDGRCQDASIVGNTLPNDEGYVEGVYDNKFGCATAYDLSIGGAATFAFALGDNVVLSFDDAGYYIGIKSNTIGNSFNSNTIGNGFSSNTIGNHFGGNIIGDDFTSNTIGNAFTINTIESGFTANVIGNYFGGNTIRGNFDTNTIGNAFNNKTISDNTTYKNYGNNGVELATKS